MKRRKLKKEILALLALKDWDAIEVELSKYEAKELVNHLFTSICSIDEILKWNGVRAFGYVVPVIACENTESARIIMRRFLWSLNDESGGIGWGAPEAMAEIMVGSDSMFQEYVHMLLSYMRGDGPELVQDGNFLELPALQQGLLWGVARLLSCRHEEMINRGVEKDLGQYLNSPDQIVQGIASLCASMCTDATLIEDIEPLMDNNFSFNLFWGGEHRPVTVADLAATALNALRV